jgi:hypothetical protein
MLEHVQTAGEDLDALVLAAGRLIDEARAEVGSGGNPPADVEARIRSLFEAARAREPAAAAAIGRAEKKALRRLEQVLSVQRARALLAQPRDRPAAPPPRRAVLRTRASITGNMDVRRESGDGRFGLAWDAAAAVARWEIRFSERESARGDYEVRETRTLPGETTRIELPLGDSTLRVHLLGRARGGRLVRRAIVSGLTRDNWSDRWQRRASAS